MNFSLLIQPSAKNYFLKLINKVQLNSKEDTSLSQINFGLKKSGCNGYAYTLDIIDDVSDFDKTEQFTFNGLPFLVKKEYQSQLNNIIIDYKKDGLNQILTYDNPNVSYECGCGESIAFKTSLV